VPTYYPLLPRPLPKLLSIVVPVYNEEEVLPLFLARIRACIDRWPWSTEVLLVNDGSADRSIEILMDAAAQDPRLKVLSLARNFGHQAAASAGLDYARGDVTALIDADLQDPPELIETMVDHYTKGFDVVCGKRASREGETWFKRVTAWLYYRLMRWLIHPQLPVDVGDFRLVSRPCLETLKSMHEVHRFLRGMVAWLGYPQTTVEFVRSGRAAGTTKYPHRKMLTFAWTSALSFSPAPLRLGSMVGALLVLMGTTYGVYAVLRVWMGLYVVKGWTSVIVLICLVGGAIMFGIGVVGEYVAKIYEQVKDRPVYVVMDSRNIEMMRQGGLSDVERA
jgi:dolichol-phosphate mannosyltransferase